MRSGLFVEGVARDGTQYEPDVYQPRGQVPTLTTGLWRPTTVESKRVNMGASTKELEKCQKLAGANVLQLSADVEVLSQSQTEIPCEGASYVASAK